MRVREIVTDLVMKMSVTLMVQGNLVMAILQKLSSNISEGTVSTNKVMGKSI